jgi:hypothetical protein
MKLLWPFLTISAISASSEAADGAVENVLDTGDPSYRWEAESYADAQWIKGAINGPAEALFLNRCNFPVARFQWNPTDAWTTPAIDISLSLGLDKAGNRKGYFSLADVSAGYFRIYIPTLQTLDNGEATPAIGNVILGAVIELPDVASFTPKVITEVKVRKTFSGGYSEDPRGLMRHEIIVEMDDDLAAIRAIPSTWVLAVFYADLNVPQDAWLVHRPQEHGGPVEWEGKALLTWVLRERV